MNSAELIQRCHNGEAGAIERLVQEHQAQVYALALSILDVPAEADEATQDVFLAALNALATYRGEAALRTWLYRITVNVCRMRLRKRRRWVRLQDALQKLLGKGQEMDFPERVTLQNEAEAAVRQAVAELDEKHRLAVILRYYHDFSMEEIAQVLGIPKGTVHSRLATARERLRAVLDDEFGSGGEG